MTSQENAIIATLASELRATEISLAQWRAHSGKLHAQLRALRKLPTDESLGEPRVLAGNSMLRSGSLPMEGRLRELSTSSTSSLMSFSSVRSARLTHSRPPVAPPAAPVVLPSFLTREFWDPKEAAAVQRRTEAATRVQSILRGYLQRTKYRSLAVFFAIVNGTVELRSGGQTVPAYTLTVVRGCRCWQVSHRFSDWIELDRQLAKILPEEIVRPPLPARYRLRTSRVVSYRQFALNSYMQQLLPLVQPHVQARRLVLNFLSRSHLHWQYADTFGGCTSMPTGGGGALGSLDVGGSRAGMSACCASTSSVFTTAEDTAHRNERLADIGAPRDGSSGSTTSSSVILGGASSARQPPSQRNLRDLRALG